MQVLKAKFESWKRPKISRRSLLFAIGYCLVLSTTMWSCNAPSNNQQQAATPSNGEKQVVRIVRSKQLSSLAVLEKQGSLEKRLEPLGFKVEWPSSQQGHNN